MPSSCAGGYPTPEVYQIIACIWNHHFAGVGVKGICFVDQDSVISQRVAMSCTARCTTNTPGDLQINNSLVITRKSCQKKHIAAVIFLQNWDIGYTYKTYII